jgi:hypothetical protein
MSINYENEVNELLQEQDEVYLIQQDDSFAIRDLGTAAWADNIVRENELKVAEIEAVYNQRLEAMKSKLDVWKDSASKKHLNNIEFFKVHLHAYHLRVIDEEKANGVPDKKLSKTIKLPTRNLTMTKQQPEILINGKESSKAKSDPVFVKFVKENNPEFIKEEVSWGDYKKTLKQKEIDGKLTYFDDAGQPIDFIELVERGVKFDWKIIKDEVEVGE